MKTFQFNTLALLLNFSLAGTFSIVYAQDAPTPATPPQLDTTHAIHGAPSKPKSTTPVQPTHMATPPEMPPMPAAAQITSATTPQTPAPAKSSQTYTTTTPSQQVLPQNEVSQQPTTHAPTHKSSRHHSKRKHHREGSDGIYRDDIKTNAPSQYIVVRGDTLWAISGRFLKKPWRWPELWQMNRDSIKNPHWIYPGDILVLEFDANGRARLRRAGHKYKQYLGRLSPSVRVEPLGNDAIPTISPSEIAPFLSKPLVINPGELKTAPQIIGSMDSRVALGQGDIIYVKDLPNDGKTDQIWQIYRQGRPLVIHKTDEHGDPADVLLGYEAVHLGDARIRTQSDTISSLEIIRAKEEIMQGDRLIPAPQTAPMNYVPRAPETQIDAQIIELPEGVAETGRNNIVAISAGSQDGLEIGHVLAIHRKGRMVTLPDDPEKEIKLPDERVGLLMIFRVFDHVSYGLVVGSERQIQIGDRLLNP